MQNFFFFGYIFVHVDLIFEKYIKKLFNKTSNALKPFFWMHSLAKAFF